MVKIVYVEPDGGSREVEVREGWSLMQGAVSSGVEGIEAECGGSCACATCHVSLDPEVYARLSPPSEAESELLDFTTTPRTPTSRLSCQIKATPDLEGVVVRIAESQS